MENLPVDTTHLEKEDKIYTFVDKDGRVHQVDLVTGQEISVTPTMEDGLVPGNSMSPVYVKGNATYWKYTQAMADMVCCLIAEGNTIAEITKRQGIPSASVLYQWKRKFPDFHKAWNAAREARAEKLHDELYELSDVIEDTNKDDLPAMKEKISLKKYLMEKNAPEIYGTNRTKIEGDAGGGVTMVVNTGIDRGLSEEDMDIIEGELVDGKSEG